MADLKQYWQQEADRQTTTLAALQADADTQAQALHDARSALSNEQAHFASVSRDIADARAALAVADVPADAGALVAALQADTIALRASAGTLADLSEDVARAAAALDVTTAAVARSRAALAAATLALATATAEKDIRDTAVAAVGAPPLSGIGTTASNAKTGPDQVAAKGQIDRLPASLIALATQQFTRQKRRLQDATDAALEAASARDAMSTAFGGAAGTTMAAARAFRRAEQKVLSLAGSGQSDLERAIGLFRRVAAPPPLLSAAEVAAIASTPARETAAAAGAAIVTAASTADGAARAYDSALLEAQAPDPEADVSADVATEKGTAETAAGAVAALRAAFTTRPDLDNWNVVAPDAVWQRVRDYLEALDILTRLSGLPGTMLADLVTAEAAYVTALDGAAAADRTLAYIGDVAAARQSVLDQLSHAADARLLGALRGDEI